MTNFETMDISLSPELKIGERADADLYGAQLKAVIVETWSDPEEYGHMPFEEKLRLADVMLARWQRYRELVVRENSISA